MSNTSVVTPYAPPPPEFAEKIQKGLSAVAKWLTDISDEEQMALDNLKKTKRTERLYKNALRCLDEPRPPCQLEVSSVSMHLKDVSSLMETAQKQGYRKVLSPHLESLSEKNIVLLQNGDSQRVAIQKQLNGQLTIHTSGDPQRVKSLVRQHTLDRALAHLTAKGMDVETKLNSIGEVELVATEHRDVHGDGRAEITAKINDAGQVRLNVSSIEGHRCQEITENLAEAVNGEISHDKKKGSFWRLPSSSKVVKQRI